MLIALCRVRRCCPTIITLLSRHLPPGRSRRPSPNLPGQWRNNPLERRACPYRKLDSAIMVVKSAEEGRRYDAARVLDGAVERRVLVERPMSPQLIIIGGILPQKP